MRKKHKDSVKMDTKSYELLIREVDIFYIWVKSCQDTAVNIISPSGIVKGSLNHISNTETKNRLWVMRYPRKR